MKLNSKLFTYGILGMLALSSCSKDNQNGFMPNEQVINAFKKQFPNATDIRWSEKKGYSVASFFLSNTKAITKEANEAWYKQNGECSMTEFEIDDFNELPTEIQEAYKATTFATDGWEIDDIDFLSRKGLEPVYKIEVEKEGQEDHDLLFSESGALISVSVDNDQDDDDNEPVEIPDAILHFVNKNFADAKLLDFEFESNEFELEIEMQDEELDLFFNASHQFLRAEAEISEKALPQAIKDELTKLGGDWQIDDIVRIAYADQSIVYVIELENDDTDKEMTLRFHEDGSIIK